MLLKSSFFVLPYISPVQHSPRCEKKRSHPGETWEPIYKVEEKIEQNFKRLRSRYRQFRGWQIEEPQLLPCTDSRAKPSSKVLRSAVARSPMAPDLPSPHLIKPNAQIVILSIFRTTTAHSHKRMLCNISTHNNSQKRNKRSCTIHLLLLTLNPSWTITTLCTLLTQNQRRHHGFFYETCTKNNAAAAVCVCGLWTASKINANRIIRQGVLYPEIAGLSWACSQTTWVGYVPHSSLCVPQSWFLLQRHSSFVLAMIDLHLLFSTPCALCLSLRLPLQEGTRKRQEGTTRLGNELCPHPCGWWIIHPPGHSHHL